MGYFLLSKQNTTHLVQNIFSVLKRYEIKQFVMLLYYLHPISAGVMFFKKLQKMETSFGLINSI